MSVLAPDAASIIGGTQAGSLTEQEVEELQRMAQGEFSRNVREQMSRDYVTMYHPDGTTSVVQLPPLGAQGKGRNDRAQKVTHYMLNKLKSVKQPDGSVQRVRWWYASPPPGWKAAELPWRCPVQECERAGGLKDLLNLWRHISNKHPGEKEMYEGVLTAIKKRLSEAVATNLDSLFIGTGGPEATVSEEDLAAATFEDAATLLKDEPELIAPQLPPETFAGTQGSFCDCGWEDKSGRGMLVHKGRYCPLREGAPNGADTST